MEFGLRLKSIRLNAGYTQQELSDAIGVSVVSLRNWERGAKRPSMDAMLSLSRELHISLDMLTGNTVDSCTPNLGLVLSPTERKLIENFNNCDIHGQEIVLSVCKLEAKRSAITLSQLNRRNVDIESETIVRHIPLYYTPSAAGVSVPLDGVDFEMIPVNEGVPADADFAVSIQGNSMWPYINDGDTVFVKKDVPLSIGDVGIFSVDGAMYCKQYYLDSDGNLVLVSANPDLRNTNVRVTIDSSQTVRAFGKVILDHRINLPDYLFE